MKSRRASLVLLIAGVAIFAGIDSAAPWASAQSVQTTVVLPQQPWTDTGITVEAGQPLTISATGTVFYINRRGYPASPAGTASCLKEKPGPFEAPALPCFSLIGRIGATGTPFEVGVYYISTSLPASGELYLGPNDDKYPDNGGSWIAYVTGGTSNTPTPTQAPTSPPATTPTPTSPPAPTPTPTPTPTPAISSTTQTPPTASTATISTGNFVITDSAPIATEPPTGILAFTGFGPLEQMITLFGSLFVLIGLALYFLGADFRTVAYWLLGL
jgi:hypothetical protein